MKQVHVECKPDQELVSKLGVTRKFLTHHQGKSKIFNKLGKNEGLLAVVDEDPGSTKTRYELSLKLQEEFEVIRHKVKDINAWLNGHQDRVKIFGPAVSGFKTFQDTDDPKSVLLVVEVTDMEKLEALMKDPHLMNDIAKDKHTVLEPIFLSMPVDL